MTNIWPSSGQPNGKLNCLAVPRRQKRLKHMWVRTFNEYIRFIYLHLPTHSQFRSHDVFDHLPQTIPHTTLLPPFAMPRIKWTKYNYLLVCWATAISTPPPSSTSPVYAQLSLDICSSSSIHCLFNHTHLSFWCHYYTPLFSWRWSVGLFRAFDITHTTFLSCISEWYGVVVNVNHNTDDVTASPKDNWHRRTCDKCRERLEKDTNAR